ncbi:hypothetical protein CERZMDRAFT_87975 [Cercospora zeae-maydis SCOH1-5]|uniref:Uncharacterized protein n=1 Tax=Cercospora zeae-maydis SCOH1-5 TaxID=717836 RepID=A0A6A6F1B1_9PEZI|nr:hypothetical protein CERZMDRAFT_87975 [Cercospora zeae-maydis SCOH1-5]
MPFTFSARTVDTAQSSCYIEKFGAFLALIGQATLLAYMSAVEHRAAFRYSCLPHGSTAVIPNQSRAEARIGDIKLPEFMNALECPSSSKSSNKTGQNVHHGMATHAGEEVAIDKVAKVSCDYGFPQSAGSVIDTLYHPSEPSSHPTNSELSRLTYAVIERDKRRTA